MKFTISWLKEHLISNFTDEKILNKLTDIGLEVESFENQKSVFDDFLVAKIENVSIEKLRQFAEHAASSVSSAMALYGPVEKAPSLADLKARRAA